MIAKLRSLLFEPTYPQRYIGRHRAPNQYPVITITLQRPMSRGLPV